MTKNLIYPDLRDNNYSVSQLCGNSMPEGCNVVSDGKPRPVLNREKAMLRSGRPALNHQDSV